MQIAIATFPEFTALDVVGPYQVLTNLPGAEVVLCAARPGTVVDDMGLLRLEVDHTFDEVPAPEVLIVPGGFVTRRLARDGDPVIDWIRRVHPAARFTASVCTGSLLLAAAGLLQGERATSHWMVLDDLAVLGAEPVEARVVQAGNVLTAAGVSAGIDMALHLAHQLTSAEVAQAIQLGIEYDPRPPFDAGSTSTAPPAITELVRTLLTPSMNAVLEPDRVPPERRPA